VRAGGFDSLEFGLAEYAAGEGARTLTTCLQKLDPIINGQRIHANIHLCSNIKQRTTVEWLRGMSTYQSASSIH